jgi:hypothetical protein
VSGGSKLPVVLIVVALLLVGLYVWATVEGTQGGFGGCMPSKETLASWQERWFKPKPIPQADLVLQGCALMDRRVRFKEGEACTIEVRGTEGKGSRSLRLQPDVKPDDNKVSLDFRPRGKDATHLQTKTLTKKADLNIPAEGALVLLTCQSKECVLLVE